jgi:hypothetical protein
MGGRGSTPPRQRRRPPHIEHARACALRSHRTLPSCHGRNDSASLPLVQQRTRLTNAPPTRSEGWNPAMLKTTITAAVIAACFSLPAHALPATSALPSVSDVRLEPVQVQHRNRHWNNRHHRNARRHHWNRRHWHGRRHYVPHRYRGWNRYSSRPWNWRARNCAVVGPVWFCP